MIKVDNQVMADSPENEEWTGSECRPVPPASLKMDENSGHGPAHTDTDRSPASPMSNSSEIKETCSCSVNIKHKRSSLSSR